MKIAKLIKRGLSYRLSSHTDPSIARLANFIVDDLLQSDTVYNLIFNKPQKRISTNEYFVEKKDNEILIYNLFSYVEDEDGERRFAKIKKDQLLELVAKIRNLAKKLPPAILIIQEDNIFKVTDSIAITPHLHKKYINSLSNTVFINTLDLYQQDLHNYSEFTYDEDFVCYWRDNNRLNQYLSLLCQLFDNEVSLLPEIKSELLNPQSRGFIGNFTDITKNGDQIIIEPLYVSDPSKYRITIAKDNLLELIDTWNTLTEQKVPYIIVKKENDKVIMYAGKKDDIVDNNSGMIYA